MGLCSVGRVTLCARPTANERIRIRYAGARSDAPTILYLLIITGE